MFCSSCGNQLNPDSRFCNGCGAPVASNATEAVGNTAVDNSAKLDNLYKLAHGAREENNAEKALQYYEQILLENPNSWEATFYSAYYSSIQKCKNNEMGSAITLLQNCIDNVLNLIKSNVKDINEQKTAIDEIVLRLDGARKALHDVNRNNFNTFYNKFIYSDLSTYITNQFYKYLEQTSSYNLNLSKIDYLLGKKLLEMCNIDISFGDLAEAAIKDAISMAHNNPIDYSSAWKSFEALDEVKRAKNTKESDTEKFEKECNNIIKQIIQKREEATKKRFEDYWKTHQSEKASLESEKQTLTEQISDINNKEIPAIPGYSEMINLNKRVEQLISEKSIFSFFKFKEKKAMQEQIDSTNNELEKVRSRVNPVIEDMRKRISQFESKIKDIDTELTKPR